MKQLYVIIFMLCSINYSDAALRRKGPTPAQCVELRGAIAKYGITVVLLGGQVRGYSPATIKIVRRICMV
jgi:hypothetical protein